MQLLWLVPVSFPILNVPTSLLTSSTMSGLQCLASENIWFDKPRYDEAEKRFYEGVNGPATHQQQVKTSTLFFFPFSQKKNQRMGVEHIITLWNKDPDLDPLYFHFPSCLLLKSFEVSSPLTLPHLMLHRHSPNSQIKQCLHHRPEQLCACELSHSI